MRQPNNNIDVMKDRLDDLRYSTTEVIGALVESVGMEKDRRSRRQLKKQLKHAQAAGRIVEQTVIAEATPDEF